MKILFISDIHGITNNLGLIEKKLKETKYDKLVCLGDLYYAGPTYTEKYTVNSNEVHDFLTKYSDMLICMKGNCDSSVDIKTSDFPISDGISLICTDGLDIYITHGNEHSFEKNRKLNRKGILVYGHEHTPYIKKNDDMIYINVGSISLPRNDIATYAIYENRKFVIYDINGNVVDSIEV
jgi:putative phosphoesterase